MPSSTAHTKSLYEACTPCHGFAIEYACQSAENARKLKEIVRDNLAQYRSMNGVQFGAEFTMTYTQGSRTYLNAMLGITPDKTPLGMRYRPPQTSDWQGVLSMLVKQGAIPHGVKHKLESHVGKQAAIRL